MRGKFITVEGGEGVGKSVFVRDLAAKLRADGRTVVMTREPGGTEVAEKLREIFVNPPVGETLTAETELLLVSAARAQHVHHRVIPALDRGEWVLCDRFADSTRVYQCILGGLDATFVEQVTQKVCATAQPDLTFVLDCAGEIALERVSQRRGANLSRFDAAGLAVFAKMRAAFRELAQRYPERMVLLDAAGSPLEVLNTGWAILKDRL